MYIYTHTHTHAIGKSVRERVAAIKNAAASVYDLMSRPPVTDVAEVDTLYGYENPSERARIGRLRFQHGVSHIVLHLHIYPLTNRRLVL